MNTSLIPKVIDLLETVKIEPPKCVEFDISNPIHKEAKKRGLIDLEKEEHDKLCIKLNQKAIKNFPFLTKM